MERGAFLTDAFACEWVVWPHPGNTHPTSISGQIIPFAQRQMSRFISPRGVDRGRLKTAAAGAGAG